MLALNVQPFAAATLKNLISFDCPHRSELIFDPMFLIRFRSDNICDAIRPALRAMALCMWCS